jgi:hypothetical protein
VRVERVFALLPGDNVEVQISETGGNAANNSHWKTYLTVSTP